MAGLDDCTRAELQRLARYATPAQIAEAKARIARTAADRERSEQKMLAAQAVAACRAVKEHLERSGGGDADYRRLFDDALVLARASASASRRWIRREALAKKLEREAARLAGQEPAARAGDAA